MSKFTPGPWVSDGCYLRSADGETDIARIYQPMGMTDEERSANARLIAAAPEMAEEIEDEIFWLEVVSCYGENAERGRMLRIKTLRALLARINEVSKETVK